MRAEMVYRLVSERGISQSEVSKRLGISRAAVSQYEPKTRIYPAGFPRETNLVIERWVSAVISGEGSITICDICRSANLSENR